MEASLSGAGYTKSSMCLLFSPYFKHCNLFWDLYSAVVRKRTWYLALRGRYPWNHRGSWKSQSSSLPQTEIHSPILSSLRTCQNSMWSESSWAPSLLHSSFGCSRVKRLIFSISELDINSVDEIYEFAICPRSGDAPAELGTIWLVRDFLPLFLLSEPDSWMPANRGRGAWQLRAESIALMQRKLSTGRWGEGETYSRRTGKGVSGKRNRERMGRRENASGSTLKRTAGEYKSEGAFLLLRFFFSLSQKKLSSSKKKASFWIQWCKYDDVL